MPLNKFNPEEVVVNTVKAHPKSEFFIYNAQIFYNKRPQLTGAFNHNHNSVPTGHISLYEINMDKLSGSNNYIFPFIHKDSTLMAFSTISTTAFQAGFAYGDMLTGSYPLSASVVREYYVDTAKSERRRIYALKNTLNHYTYMSDHYAFSSSHGDKSLQTVNLLSVPSIFYGSSIKKGTVHLKYLVTGSLVGELKDEKHNGELIQTGPEGSTGSGSVAGIILYTEGIMLLTASWSLDDTANYPHVADLTETDKPRWKYFGFGANDGIGADASRKNTSFVLSFSGTNYIQTLTMLAHANKGEANYSTNPTFIQSGSNKVLISSAKSSSAHYLENHQRQIKNTVSSSYRDHPGEFERQTYISRVAIYDDQKNLIGIATTSTPIKKPNDRKLTFKLKLDI